MKIYPTTVIAPQNAAISPEIDTSPEDFTSPSVIIAPNTPTKAPAIWILFADDPKTGIKRTTIIGCIVTNNRLWTRVVLSNDQTHEPKCNARKILEINNNFTSFLEIKYLFLFKYCIINNGNNINDVPCILHEALRNGGIPSIDCNIVPAEDTANNARIRSAQAKKGCFFSPFIINPPIRHPLFHFHHLIEWID